MNGTVKSESVVGVIPPVITPMNSDGTVDFEAFRSEVMYTSQQNIGGLLVGAATGEGYALKPDETAELCRVATESTEKKELPLIAGVLAPSTPSAVEQAKAAASGGADALMVTAPTYFPAQFDSLRTHYAAVIQEAGIPVVVYNAMAHNPISVGDLVGLTELEGIVAVKQGMGGSLPELRQLLEDVGDQVSVIWSQDKLLFEGYCLGARGSMATVDAILPEQTVALREAVHQGDLATARRVGSLIAKVGALLGPTDWPAAAKAAIEMQGRRAGVARPPYQIGDERRRAIMAVLRESGLAVAE